MGLVTKDSKFMSKQCVATPGALSALAESGESANDFLVRHFSGDWGDLAEGDDKLNEEALLDGSRLMSSYKMSTGTVIWVITEAENEHGVREVCTTLLPDEY